MTGLSLAVGIGTDAGSAPGRLLLAAAGSSSAREPAHKIQGQTRRPTRGCTRGRIGRRAPSRSLSSYALSDRCAATELDGATASQTRWLKGQLGPAIKPPPRAINEEPLYRGDRSLQVAPDRRCES